MPKQRCAQPGCKRRLKAYDLSLGACSCGKHFCHVHRLPEDHDGDHDWSFDKAKEIDKHLCVRDKMSSTNGSCERLS